MPKIIFPLLAAILLVVGTQAQTPAKIKHLDGNSFSSSVLTKRLAFLVDSAQIAGLSVAVINNHKIVYQAGFGYRIKEQGLPMEALTANYAASLTKPVACYTVLRMVQAGSISLDKPVYQYLPKPIGTYSKWKDLAKDTATFNKITLRMLMSHTSGMPILRFLYGDSLRLIAKPGTKFYYSNEGLNFLGFVLEEFTGKPFEALAQTYTFGPLGITHTHFVWDSLFNKNYSVGYQKDGSLYGVVQKKDARTAGSMTTTAPDYARFLQEVMQPKFLSPNLQKEMLKPHIKIISTRGFGPYRDTLSKKPDPLQLAWGLGVGLIQTPHGRAFLHGGHYDGNQNYFIAYPDKGIAVIFLCNSARFEPTATKMLQACIGSIASPLEWMGYYD